MVHLGGFILDLTVGFWLLWPKSRPLALFFATSFHMMNAQLFTIGIYSSLLFYYIAMEGGKKTISLNLIYHQPKTTFFFLFKGMFPYVCLATLPVFCDDDWPKRWIAGCPGLLRKCLPDATKITNVCDSPVEKRGKNSSFKLTLMGLYVVTQLALPWSHSVTQVC
jgi:vitamin K-dependent gamma-carboxylase